VLGQLGESRLVAAIDADIAGDQAHSRVLDADTKGALRDIHRRLGTAVLFESSGGQIDKVAHLPELRFALGEPGLDTTSIDTAAATLESKAFFVRKVGSDGFQIRHTPTLKKVVNDRRASLDHAAEVKPAMRRLVENEFREDATIPIVAFPEDGAAIQDTPRLTLVLMDPEWEWTDSGDVRERISTWTRKRGTSDRLYPGALVWCLKKPGRELRDKTELMLAWERVQREVREGVLGSEFDRADLADLRATVSDAEDDAKDEVWAGYRFVVLADSQARDGLKVVDLGAGHASSSESLCGRVVAALKSEALLNESVGAGYIDRNWPPALKESGAWPLASLRQSFLNGALTRLLDPDTVLRQKIVQFVERGAFGLASGSKGDGEYERVWYEEAVAPDEVAFESGVFLLTKEKARTLKEEPTGGDETEEGAPPEPPPSEEERGGPGPGPGPGAETEEEARTIRIKGTVPPELWNRMGTKILPKLRSGIELTVGVEFTVKARGAAASSLENDLRQILADLGLTDQVRME
jgi:hypothetical protein